MSPRSRYSLFVICLVLTVNPIAQAEPPAGAKKPVLTDALGDPLPPGVVARLGTERLWAQNTNFLAFSPDAKALVTVAGGGYITAWEVSTGKELWRAQAPGFNNFSPAWSSLAFSPDGKLLALCCSDKSIRLWDAAGGREVRKIAADGAVSEVAFSPDGRLLAAGGHGGSIRVWSAAAGKSLGTWGEFKAVSALAFSADGKALVALATGPDAGQKRAFSHWDVSSGKEVKQVAYEDKSRYAGRLSPDGKYYAALSDDTKRVQLFDAATGKQERLAEGETKYPGVVAFSADGRAFTMTAADGVARIWGAGGGKPLREFKALSTSFDRAALSRDGKLLALSGTADQAIHIWDVARGKELHAFPGHRAAPLTVAFARDGKTVFTIGGDGKVMSPVREWGPWSLRQWDVATGKELRLSLAEKAGELRFVAVSPGGALAANVFHDGTLRLWDLHAGKELRDWKVSENTIWGPAFSADGKTVFHADQTGLRRWDAETGKELSPLPLPGRIQYPGCLGSPDGRTVIVTDTAGGNNRLFFLDAKSGVVVHQTAAMKRALRAFAFSPDGRTLAVSDIEAVALWEVASGRERGRLTERAGAVLGLTFSPDGRFLALGSVPGQAERLGESLRLIDLASGRQVGGLDLEAWRIDSLSFSPDGNKLALGGFLNAALVCDVDAVRKERPAAPAKLTAAEVDRLWDDLAGADGEKAYRAILRLASAPEALPVLKGRMKTPAEPDERGMARLLRDLDADDFQTREKASRELERLGSAIEPALRRALDDKPSAEVRARIENLLSKLKSGATGAPSAELVSLRVLESLECAGSPEARAVLREVAKGPAGARVTREARESLERLASRAGKTP